VELGKRIQEVGFLLHPSPGPALSRGKPLLELANEMLEAKAPNVSESYLTQLYHTMKLFCDGRWSRPVDSFTPKEIEAWSLSRNWAAATRRTKLTDVRTLFSWAVRREHLKKSPCDAIELPPLEDRPPMVHDPGQVEKLLRTARDMDVDIMRTLAIEYFSGLRPLSEAARLQERNILPSHIEVEGAKCKTRKRRLVKIQPALKAWLDVGGRLPVRNLKRRWLAVRLKAGLPWGQDVIRHTFCTYHLAYFENAALTAVEAGHDEAVLFSKYRSIRTPAGELITKELAAEFWGIRP
jgi:integrase